MPEVNVAEPEAKTIIHLRLAAHQLAACGAAPGTPWTSTPAYVACNACQAARERGWPRAR